MLVDTFTNTLAKKIFGKEFIPRFARYLIKFPDYMNYPKTAKFAKVFTRERFPLYGMPACMNASCTQLITIIVVDRFLTTQYM